MSERPSGQAPRANGRGKDVQGREIVRAAPAGVCLIDGWQMQMQEGCCAGRPARRGSPDAEEYLPPRARDALRTLLEGLDEAGVVVRHGRRLKRACGEGVLRTKMRALVMPDNVVGKTCGELGRAVGLVRA